MSDGRHRLRAGDAAWLNPRPWGRTGIGRRLVGRRYGPCDGLRRVFPTARRRGVTAPCLGWPPGSALASDRVMIGILCQAVTVVVRALTTAQYGPSRQPYQAVSTVHHVHAHESGRRVRHREDSAHSNLRGGEGVNLRDRIDEVRHARQRLSKSEKIAGLRCARGPGRTKLKSARTTGQCPRLAELT